MDGRELIELHGEYKLCCQLQSTLLCYCVGIVEIQLYLALVCHVTELWKHISHTLVLSAPLQTWTEA